MESEEDDRGSSDNEEGTSEAESEERVELVRAKSDANAPGVGVVADHYHVGGRDERVSGGSYRTNAEPKISGDKRERTMRKRAGRKSDESGCSSMD